MTAQEWFSRIRDRVSALQDKEKRLEQMRSGTEAKGQRYDTSGRGGGGGDSSGAILHVIQAEQDLDRDRARINAEIDRALGVLYGKSGRGGLAKAKDSATADSICGHYLMGMSWREVADELVKPNSTDGEQWCRRRAYRGFEYIDRHGTGRLVSS